MTTKKCETCYFYDLSATHSPCNECYYFEKWQEGSEHPFESHYDGTIQPLEFMQAQMTQEEFRGFLKGNIIKYTARCGKKDDPAKEMTKVLRYAKWLKESYEGKTVDPRK